MRLDSFTVVPSSFLETVIIKEQIRRVFLPKSTKQKTEYLLEELKVILVCKQLR